MNLVQNALKFSRTGTVTILAGYFNDKIVVNVIDTGVGILREDFPKLFTRFGKLQRTASLNTEGIGLGLTMVKQIVKFSGGIVGVHSKGAYKGSVFSFSMLMEQAAMLEQSQQDISES